MWLFILAGNEIAQDSSVVDSVKKYEVPTVVNFSQAGVLDSSLKQTRVIEPVLFFTGFKEVVNFTPYLIKDRGYCLDIITPYPLEVFLQSHSLNNYFTESFNPVLLPIHFLKTAKLNNGFGKNFQRLEIDTKVNTYEKPYSYLYFTMFGNNTIYNLDFTRAITNDIGFYLSGLYSRQYKNYEQVYLRTNGGYANIYYNQFIPSRLDIIFTDNDYGTLWSIDFSDITFTAGNDLYKLAIFRTANGTEYLDTLSNVRYQNHLTTYGTNQQMVFSYKNIGNVFGFNATTSRFEYGFNSFETDNNLEFYQGINYNLNRFCAGFVYSVDYALDKNLYFNPGGEIKYDIFDNMRIFGGLSLSHRRANFIAHYGNENLAIKDFNILGNPDIKDEEYFHKEIGLQIKNLNFNFYHCAISSPIGYHRDSANYYSAVNFEKGEIAGLELFYDIPLGKYFSFAGVFNYLLKDEPSSIFPRTNAKLYLNWQRETERSVICLFTRFNYISDRYDLAENHYSQFWNIAPGLTIKFITLKLSMMIDNILDQKPADFPDVERSFNLEIKWEFWD